MRLLRSGKSRHVFHLGRREKQLLLEIAALYPLVPATHHRLSKRPGGSQSGENQHLLEEALAEQRQENRRQLLAMLQDTQRFRETKTGFELKLTPSEIEWLLQVFNDVRVGSWLALGEPEPGDEPVITEENVKYLLAMQLCGFFESVLLAALGINEEAQWAGE
jgi:hypothetical protein